MSTPSIPRSSPRPRSLASLGRQLERALDREPEEFSEVYDHVHRLVFHQRSRRKNTQRNATSLRRAQQWCLDHEIDFASYVAANMVLLRGHLSRGFAPNMLVGERAQERYHAYVGRLSRRYRSGSWIAGLSSETWLGRLRDNVCHVETEVAEFYVRCNLLGDAITWEEASEGMDLTPEWVSMTDRRGRAWVELCSLWDRDRAERERQLMILSAAWSVSEGLRHGLSERIMDSDVRWPDFRWSRFANAVRKLVPRPEPRQRIDLSGVDCVEWVPGGGSIDWRRDGVRV